LASFLTAQTVPGILIESAEEVVSRKLSVCADLNSVSTEKFSRKFKYHNFCAASSEIHNEADVWKAVVEGKGDVGYGAMYSYQAAWTKDCKLKLVGPPVFPSKGGYMLKKDAARCTDTIRTVMRHYFLQMDNDGFLDLEKRKYLWPGTCMSDQSAGTSNEPLHITNMSGIFIFHAFFVVMAIILRLCCVGRKKASKDHLIQAGLLEAESQKKHVLHKGKASPNGHRESPHDEESANEEHGRTVVREEHPTLHERNVQTMAAI
jgi:hypothetical protein